MTTKVKSNLDEINRITYEISSLAVYNMSPEPCMQVQNLLREVARLTGAIESLTEVKE